MIFGVFSRVSFLCNSSKFLSKNSFKFCYNNFKGRGLCSTVAESLKNKPSVVHAIPALRDNYMYVVINHAEKLAFAIDPVEPDKVLELVERENAVLQKVLTTHHHFDHSGGNEEIKRRAPQVDIYGADSRIPAMTYEVKHGDTFNIGSSFTVECLLTPCHTRGHACFFVKQKGVDPICFTGDTLFVAGCGRFFEGNGENMLSSLNILSNLPHQTKIYCGHEYTVNNLKFALEVEPSNLAAAEKLSWAIERQEEFKATVPSTISEELKYNPFLRVREAGIQDYTKQTDPVKVMDALRAAKDNFRPT